MKILTTLFAGIGLVIVVICLVNFFQSLLTDLTVNYIFSLEGHGW